MSADPRSCPSCGAQVPADADRCDLCGTPVDPSAADHRDAPTDAAEPPESKEDSGPSVFCNQCGWENPPGARFCSRCGTELQDLSDVTPSATRPVAADLPTKEEPDPSADLSDALEDDEQEEADEQAVLGQQIALVVGGALALVVALFFVTQWSAQYEWGGDSSAPPPAAEAGPGGNGPAASGGQQSMSGPARGGDAAAPTGLQTLVDQTEDSLSGSMAGQIDSLRTGIGQASGDEKQRLQTELVNLLIGAGQPGRAAVVQKEIADATGTVEARRRTADLLYRWMQKLERQGQRKQISQIARHAARAYEAVSKKRPDDLDARTRMGEAYLLTNEPMRGIQAINAVLEDDSTFVPARFQKGLAFLQINRVDQAVQQFEAVKRYADDGSAFYQQADRALTVIEEQQSGASSGPSSPGPTANP